MSNEKEIHALIQLLDDDDTEVYKHVHDKLLSLGAPIIPTLEQAWEAELNPATNERIEDIIHEIQFKALTSEWVNWLGMETPDLLTGAYLISKYHYPETCIDELQKRIFKIKQSIWLELNYNQTPLEQIQIFNQVFYTYHGFKGSQSSADYHDFCIRHVLESKKGNSISIGILYQITANELNLPVYGVPLIRHYVLAHCKKIIFDFNSEESAEREVMFYINPINQGSVFSRSEISDYLTKMNAEKLPKYFTPTSPTGVISELLQYLIEVYTYQKKDSQVAELSYLQKMLK